MDYGIAFPELIALIFIVNVILIVIIIPMYLNSAAFYRGKVIFVL
jgi:hypothetical protein